MQYQPKPEGPIFLITPEIQEGLWYDLSSNTIIKKLKF